MAATPASAPSPSEESSSLSNNTKNIRNVCIVAHVDHGKTTLADSLISSNGIISSRSAGKIRYLDHTKEEQLRGITMKSSSISLLYQRAVAGAAPGTPVPADHRYLINLIDSPGHMAFSSEVSSALRICDGCLVLVDVIEGVCIQTRAVLRQAWMEKVKPVLVLNKIDRLITHLNLTPMEAYEHIVKILQQVNVVSGSLWAEEVLRLKEQALQDNSQMAAADSASGGEDLFEKLSDEEAYFLPDRGNVVFASAVHGWGFRIEHFCELYGRKLGINASMLRRTLWGDFYLNPKTKKIYNKPIGKSPPMFVQFVLNNIWEVYRAVTPDRDAEKLQKIVKALNLAVPPRELQNEDPTAVIQAVMGKWLPVSDAILQMTADCLPNPIEAQKTRIPHIYRPMPIPNHEAEQAAIAAALQHCDSSPTAPLVGFVSKVFAVPNDQLVLDMRLATASVAPRQPKSRPNPRAAAADSAAPEESLKKSSDDTPAPSADPPATPADLTAAFVNSLQRGGQSFIAMARLFSGTLRVGDKLHVLGVRYNPLASVDKHRVEIVVPQLFLLMGRSLQPIKEVRAGQVFGFGGDGVAQIVKTATLSSSPVCASFDSMKNRANPIVRVAIEPEDPADMQKLQEGLRLLFLADPAVDVQVQDNGEQIVAALGEMHLARCLAILTEDFAKIKVKVSTPIVSFRESMVKQLARGVKQDFVQELAEHVVTVTVRAIPLPWPIVQFLEANAEKTKRFMSRKQGFERVEQDENTVQYREELRKVVAEAGEEWKAFFDGPGGSQLWAFGPRRVGSNVLINQIPQYAASKYWRSPIDNQAPVPLLLSDDGKTVMEKSGEELVASTLSTEQAQYFFGLQQFENSIRTGFQLATKSGPLCDEPMCGVAFIVSNVAIHKPKYDDAVESADETSVASDDWSSTSGESAVKKNETAALIDEAELTKNNAPQMSEVELSGLINQMGRLSGFVISSIRLACRRAFLQHEQRLVEAYFNTAVQCNAENLGKVHAVLARRRAKVLNEEVNEGSSMIVVTAHLPAAESFGFAEELFAKTSGSASAQLELSHWDILDIDPNFVPTTEEELEEWGDNVGGIAPNTARKHIDAVRRRKGLPVQERTKLDQGKVKTRAKKK